MVVVVLANFGVATLAEVRREENRCISFERGPRCCNQRSNTRGKEKTPANSAVH